MLHSIKFCIDTTTPRTFVWPFWVLFVLVMQSVNGAQFFYKSLLLFWGFFQLPCCCVFWSKCFEGNPYFALSRNNSTILPPKFQNKVLIYFNIKISLTILFKFCDCVTLSFINDLFLQKIKISLEACSFTRIWLNRIITIQFF